MLKNNIIRDFEGKSALITGASSGIGKEIAKMLAEQKCKVFLLGTNVAKLKGVTSSINKSNNDLAKYFVCDVTDSKYLMLIQKRIARIDFLVNVAGISATQKKGELDEKVFDKLVETNLKSAYLTSMIFGYKSINKNGSIVNISSIRARTGTPSFSPGYAAAKAGLLNITKSFALELADRDIRVNAVAPGPTYPTGLSKNWSKSIRKKIANTIPLKRLASPTDVANAVVFLLSNKAGYITGHTLDVNGGLWMN